MVSDASAGVIDISKKKIGLNGSSIYHEYVRHSNSESETSRDQIAFDKETFKKAIQAIYSPDVVEALITKTDVSNQAQSFAYAKQYKGYFVVAEVVGGKYNPLISPVEILWFTESKWKKMIDKGLTLGEMLYQNNAQKLNVLDIEAIKNNRVIAAKFPQTSETSTYSAFSSVDNDNTSSSIARQEEIAENSKKSLREDTSLPREALIKENETLKKDIGNLRELLKLQSKITDGKRITRHSSDIVADRIMKQFWFNDTSTYTKQDVRDIFFEMYSKIQEADLGTNPEMLYKAINTMAAFIEEGYRRPDAALSSDAQNVLNNLKGRHIKLTSEQIGDVVSRFGSYNDFRRAFKGTGITFESTATMALDEHWSELASMFPSYFDENVSEGDMPEAYPSEQTHQSF